MKLTTDELAELGRDIEAARQDAQRLFAEYEKKFAEARTAGGGPESLAEAENLYAQHVDAARRHSQLRQHQERLAGGGAERAPHKLRDAARGYEPGSWLAGVLEMHAEVPGPAPATTAQLGSISEDTAIFFDRLDEQSAILSTPGVQIADIDTSEVKVGRVTGRMAPAVPVAELDPIPKDEVPIGDAEIKPPKWPKLITLSLEAYRDARPIRLAAVETEMFRAIATGFDASCFHGTEESGHVGFEHIAGVEEVPLDGALADLDWVADAIGELLEDFANPGVAYISPYTVRSLLKLKKQADSNEPLVGDLARAGADLLGVPVKITSAVDDGSAFVADPRTLLVVRRQDVETRVFEDYGFENAEVGVRAIARMQLEASQPQAVKHVTGLPFPEVPMS